MIVLLTGSHFLVFPFLAFAESVSFPYLGAINLLTATQARDYLDYWIYTMAKPANGRI